MVWNEWLTAKFNVRYYNGLRLRYSTRDKVLRGFLALTSSSTIAGLAFWSYYPPLWQGFVAATAIAAVVNPILGYSKLLGDLSDGYGRWAQAQFGFEDLWDRLRLGMQVEFQEFQKIRASVLAAVQAEIDIPIDKRLSKQCYDAIMDEVKPLLAKVRSPSGQEKPP